MDSRIEPLVSIVTPVYNGAKYLAECIESVLAQTYQHWEHVIVDNCSTDATFEVASKYARNDSRLRLVSNEQFVDVIENHNIGFRLISSSSKYCKVICADDYLFPECIAKLVEMGERYPSASIIGSYAISRRGVHWIGLNPEQSFFPGRDVCRDYLLGNIAVFVFPSAAAYLSDVVRANDPFYPGPLPNSDFAACLAVLEKADFAFVHQVLCFERIHCEAISSKIEELQGFLLDRLQFLLEYGPKYLTDREKDRRKRQLLKEIYCYLAVAVIHFRGKRFWRYQKGRFQACGCRISSLRIAVATCAKLLDLLLNPKDSTTKVLQEFRKRLIKSRQEGFDGAGC